MPWQLSDVEETVKVPELTGTTGRSARNFNYLNVEYHPGWQDQFGAVPEPGYQRFSAYPTPEAGYLANLETLRRYQNNQIRPQPGGHTLSSFVYNFSPPHENPTEELISQYGNQLGVTRDTPLANIPTAALFDVMAARESSTRRAKPSTPQWQLTDLPETKQPQPGPVAPITDILGSALATDQGGAIGAGLPQSPAQAIPPPTSLESTISGYIPQSIRDALSQGVGYIHQGVNAITPTVPQGGALQGAYLGGRLGAMTGNPIGATGGALLGAGLGYVGGQQAENVGKVMGGEQMPPVGEQLKEAGKGFMTGVTGEMGGQSFGKLMAPFADTVGKRIAENEAIAQAQELVQKGARISPSEIAGTRTARALEWIAEKMWPASSRMAKSRQSLQDVAEGLKTEFVNSRGLYDVSKKSVGEAWDNWVNLAGGADAAYIMPNAIKAVNDAMNKPFAQTGAFWKKQAATFASEAESGQVSVQAIRDLFNTLNPSSSRGAERTARMKIAEAITKDLESVGGPEVADALANARDLSFMNRTVGPLRAIFNQAMIEPKTAGDMVQFSPSKFVNTWNQRRSNFLDNKNYSEADIAAIDKFAAQMRALMPDLAKAQKFTTPTSLSGITQFNLENPLAVGGAIYQYPALSVPVGMDYFLAGSLMNPNGMMRKWLTTGLKPPTLPVKLGVMKGFEND